MMADDIPDKMDVSDKSNETDKPDKSDIPDKSDKMDVSDKSDETDNPDKSDKPDETDKPNELDKPDESDKPKESDKSDESDKPDKTDKPNEADKPDESAKPDKPLVKVMVCCGIGGRIKMLVECIERLCIKKGAFDYVFCIGDFFGDDKRSEREWESYIKSKKVVSVPVYTLGPNKPEHVKYFENLKDQQLAPNIFYLGKDGVFSTSDGLKIGYISGIQNDKGTESDITSFNYDSVVRFKESCVRAGIVSLDLLLTSPWPVDIRNKERIPENQKVDENPVNKEHESPLLSWVAVNLAPRYFFSGLQNVYLERSPHKNNNSNTVTRFIGLGNFLHKAKQKSMYGFILSPIEPNTKTKTDYTVTESPYDDQSKYIANVLPASKQYFFNTNTNSNGPPNKKRCLPQKINQSIDINAESCWFCLSSKNISKHMIVSIGDQVYLAGTKGPLVKEHVLISPIEHYKSFAEIPTETENEINLIKSCLNQYFESTDRVAIYFERTILSAHFQLQVVPIPSKMIDQVEEMFKNKFKDYDLSLVGIPPAASLRQIAGNSGGHYFCVELPNGKRLFHSAVKKSGIQQQKFPLQIAREVLASPKLLNVENRIDWKKCAQSQDEETADVNSLRSAFEPFNPIKD